MLQVNELLVELSFSVISEKFIVWSGSSLPFSAGVPSGVLGLLLLPTVAYHFQFCWFS